MVEAYRVKLAGLGFVSVAVIDSAKMLGSV
jgi:hypothetical protein